LTLFQQEALQIAAQMEALEYNLTVGMTHDIQLLPQKPSKEFLPAYERQDVKLIKKPKLTDVAERKPLPDWLKLKYRKNELSEHLRGHLKNQRLHTVCQSALCPNIGECWSHGTATFMILGDICTRTCKFCGIASGRPDPVDPDEPRRVAENVHQMGLKHAVITSVARDELADQGAGQFAAVIRAIHDLNPAISVEVLVPDFRGREDLVQIVTDAAPEVFNHNIETTKELHKTVRPQARYERSLQVLATAKRLGKPEMKTKSGFMVGLGETFEDVLQILRDLREAGVQIVTIGQYLQARSTNLPVVDYIHPDVFKQYHQEGMKMGFDYVFSGPFVRSSYRAEEALWQARG